jgi:hypothetical protein
VRQVGAALGVAVIGSVFASLTVSKTIAAVQATKLPAALQSTAAARIHSQGAGFPVPRGTAPADAATLGHALATGLTDAARPAILVAAGFVTLGAFLSLLLPRTAGAPRAEPLVEQLEALEPVERDRSLVDEREPA